MPDKEAIFTALINEVEMLQGIKSNMEVLVDRGHVNTALEMGCTAKIVEARIRLLTWFAGGGETYR